MRTTASASSVSARTKPRQPRKAQARATAKKARHDVLRLERLEDRLMMAADILDGGLAQAPLSSLPQLHSNASATAKLFLDFDGHFEATWGGYTNVSTPAFDQDGDPTTFSAGELDAINQIWARVAEDYAPFNLDVTTVDPGNESNYLTAVIAIGGSDSDWYGGSAGGVSYVGGFFNLASNAGYVFAQNLSNDTKYVAEAAAHEAGHLFGLQHQASWSGNTLIAQYNGGNGAWAPIMGTSYSATRTTWYNGPTTAGPTAYQDDMAIISGSLSGFGYRADDYGGTIGTATSLPTIGTSINFSGLIGQANDVDMWSFTTTGGSVTFQLTGAQYGTNLDAVLELQNSSGTAIITDSPSNSLGASLTTTLSAGTYYLVARSVGDYGDVGQYTITGSLPAASTTPEVALSVSGVAVADGGSINFGSTSLGTAVTKTFTVTNQGSGVLTLTNLNAGSMPSGFTLVSNLGATSLNPGASTTFAVRLDATAAGSFGGTIQLFSDDSDESPYDLVLSGTVTAPEISIAISGTGVNDGQTVDFGSTTQGQSVTRVFTVTNTGTSTLSLTSINAGSLPSGFTLVSNIGSTALAAGQSTTFSIRLDATTAGSFSGSIQLLNNDSDENPFDITLTGSVSAPEIAISLGGTNLTSGQTVNFGATTVGQAVSQTFTVTNTGSATLTLTPLNAGNLPAGFTLVSNLGSTSLGAGQSTTFSVRLDATAVGSYSTSLQLANNDADESSFVLNLSGVVQAPEITIKLGGTNLSDGQSIDFGSTGVGTSVSRTFTVINDGTSTLSLTAIDPAGLPAGFSLVTNLGSTSLGAGQSTSFTVRFDASSVGSFGGSLALASNDSDESSFDLQLQGIALAPAPGHATVLVAGQDVAAGSTVNFGTTVTGSTLERTIWIRNDGGSVLNLSAIDPASLPAGYSLLQALTQTSLAAGETTSFILRLGAQTSGNCGGQVSLDSDDPNGPFTFDVTASVVDPIPPLVQILDDGDPGISQSGAWQKTSGKGYAADFHSASKGTGQAAYSWTFTSLPAGQYRVYATWISGSTNASNAPFSLFDGSTKRSTIAVNERVAPSGLAASGANWKLVGTVSAASGQLTVRLTNAANGKVVADAIRIERVIPVLPPTPEIDLLCNNSNLTSGSSAVDFGSPDLGGPQIRTFTIVNHGTGSLTLTPLDPASLPAGFSLVENLGTTFLTPGESTTFSVQLDADAAGSFAGTISVLNNDANDSCFCFHVTGTVYDPAAPVTRIIDDGSLGNSRAGTWTHVTTAGNAGDQYTAAAGKGTSTSTWTFGGLANGEYKVQASWKVGTTLATNAPYSFLNGSQLLGTVHVNQRIAPHDQWDGVWFENLATVTVTGHQLTVKLTNAANGTVVADAIRIEKILPAGAALPELETPLFTQIVVREWLPSLFASSESYLPDELPLPSVLRVHLAASQGPSQPDVFDSAGTELEDRVLADVLDLISEAQQGLSGSQQADANSAHDLALRSVLSPLL